MSEARGGAPVIEVKDLTKAFGSFVAVKDATFSVAPGEFFSLLGPSGCGKTTTLRLVAGFESPTSGTVRLAGRDVADVPPWKRNVNTVFQHYALFPHLSVADNVAFGPRSRKRPRAEVERSVRQALEMVRLGELGARRPAQLSGGQQQRVALARALVNLPSALLLDEPLAALDLKLREAMQLELKRIQREVGIAFVLVTHDQGEALAMSDRVAVMRDGVVEQVGTPEEIYRRPASLFVASFIGTANLLPGTAGERGGDEVVVELSCGPRVACPGGAAAGLAAGEAVTVMLRPERLRLIAEAPADGRGLETTVVDLVFQGASTRLQLAMRDGTRLVTHVPSHSAPPIAEPGRELWVTWEPGSPHVLPGWPQRPGATSTDVDEVEASL